MIHVLTFRVGGVLALLLLVSACSSPHVGGASGARSLAEDVKPSTEYLNGKQLCEKFSALTKAENGFYVPVPVNYKDPAQGKTEIYAYFRNGKFDPALPTYVYVHGGPGGNAHTPPEWDSMHLRLHLSLGHNLLFFDQRGSSCSRPATKALYESNDFYSSENSARDMEEIRKFLGLKQWAVYGVSYGTVVATVYGHFFPSATRAVVLEGVLFDSQELYLGNSALVPNQVQKILDSLSPAGRKQVVRLTSEGTLPKNWFTGAVGHIMASAGTKDVPLLRSAIDEALTLSDDQFGPYVRKTFGQRARPEPQWKTISPEWEGLSGNDAPSEILICKELGGTLAGVHSQDSLHLEGDRIVTGENTDLSNCQKRGLEPGKMSSYNATNYPLSVPVSYLQGIADSRTPAIEASLHYKRVAKSLGQILFFQEAGHTPSWQISRSATFEKSPQWDHLRDIFKTMISGQAVSKASVEAFIQAGPVRASFTQKGIAPSIPKSE